MIRYKDIGELMRRCETLIATRDNLVKTRDKIKATISEEQDALAVFKEDQNERLLELRSEPTLVDRICSYRTNGQIVVCNSTI